MTDLINILKSEHILFELLHQQMLVRHKYCELDVLSTVHFAALQTIILDPYNINTHHSEAYFVKSDSLRVTIPFKASAIHHVTVCPARLNKHVHACNATANDDSSSSSNTRSLNVCGFPGAKRGRFWYWGTYPFYDINAKCVCSTWPNALERVCLVRLGSFGQ